MLRTIVAFHPDVPHFPAHLVAIVLPHMTNQPSTNDPIAFRFSEDSVDLALSIFPIPVWIYSRETLEILEVNKAAEFAYGYSREEFLHLRISDIRPETEKRKLETYLSEDPDCHDAGIWEHRIRSGKIIHVHIYSSPIEFMGQRCRIVTANNVTDTVMAREALLTSQRELEQKNEELERTQQNLIEEQRRLKYIIEGTNVGTWEWDIETGWTSFSPRWAEIIGYTLEELEPIDIQTWVKYCHEEDMPRSNAELQAHFAGEKDYYECEVRMRHRAGHWVWVLDRGKVHEWTAEGKPKKMSGTHQDITQQKHREFELRRVNNELATRNAQIEAVSHLAKIGFWECDLTTHKVVWSDEACRIFGVEPGTVQTLQDAEEVSGLMRMNPTDAEGTARALDGESIRFIRKVKTKDGAEKSISVFAVPVIENGAICRFYGLLEDVSERIEREGELQSKNEELHTKTVLVDEVSKLAHIGYFEWDLIDKTMTLSAEGSEICDLTPGYQPTFDEIFSFFDPDDRDLILTQLNYAKLFSTDCQLTLCMTTRRGNKRWLKVFCKYRYRDGNIADRLQGLFMDVTEQHIASERLRESESRFKSMADSSPSIIWMTDANNKTVYFSKEWYNYTGTSPSDQLDVIWMESVHPDDRDEVLKVWLRHAQNHEKFSIDYRLRKYDGTYEWFADSGIPRYSAGTLAGYIGTCMNQHSRIEYEERLVHTLKEKEVLIREIHHRVKNNLQLISSLMFMKAESNPTPEVQEMMRYVRLHISSVSLIYEKLLQHNSIDRISIGTYLSSLVREIVKGFQRKHFELRIEEHYHEIFVDHDTSTFCGLVVNELLTNAYKHAFPDHTEGTMTISVKEEDGEIELTVSDNGVGLREIETREQKSHGLQLIQLMLKQLRGTLTLDSSRGTAFTLSFPIPKRP